jgi:hypothetical protein
VVLSPRATKLKGQQIGGRIDTSIRKINFFSHYSFKLLNQQKEIQQKNFDFFEVLNSWYWRPLCLLAPRVKKTLPTPQYMLY